MQKLKLVDTTLREGEQTPGLIFSIEQKKEIVSKLLLSGVDEIELGIASPCSTELPTLINYCCNYFDENRFSLWARCMQKDIDFAASCKIKKISLSIPASDLHLHDKMNKSRAWAAETLKASIAYARKRGLLVAVGFEDATRADITFLKDMAQIAEKMGAFRIRLADTVGIASPGKISDLVQAVHSVLSTCEVGVHTHNDFGMATGNAIAAFESNASWADGAMLGLGERTGCAPLEQLVAYLELVCGDLIKQIKPLKDLAEYLARTPSISINKRAPILGSDIFICETGLHLHGLFKEPKTYEPYPPEKVGARRKLMIGAKSGKYAIQKQMQLLGEDKLSKPVLEKCVKMVRQSALDLGRSLSNDELLSICKL
ncbi:MAG: hypothetical protein OCC45_12340 [Desulfotalea sp.]